LDDITEESVNNWLEDNGDLFGLTKPEVNEERELNRAALRQQDVVTQLGSSPDRAEDLLSRINNAASAEELNSIIYSQQQ
jgi:DNA-binding transcriptional regulator YbjK